MATADPRGGAGAANAERPIAEVAAEITAVAGRVNAVNRRWLELIAEFDRREGWAADGARSCAHWLNWKCGLDLGAAREKVRVAHALERLPRIAAAMASGELSYSKARALTRVATAANEGELLEAARHATAHHVEAIVRQFRRSHELAEITREARQYARRQLVYAFDEDGGLALKVRLTAETGALVLRALAAAMADVPLPDVSAETSSMGGAISAGTPGTPGDVAAETSPVDSDWAARRADAFAVICESFLKHGAEALGGGERHEIVLHVSAETLTAGGGDRCELEDGPAVAVETGRRLACDASLVAILEDAKGEPLDVGRKTRTIPPALRRALASRDGGCVFPGCTHKRYVDGHHLQHWADGGETRLANLVTLCRFHHRAVHEGGMRVERLDDGAWRFTRPDGEVLESVAHGHTRPLPVVGLESSHGDARPR